jgi:hypothetical protein
MRKGINSQSFLLTSETLPDTISRSPWSAGSAFNECTGLPLGSKSLHDLWFDALCPRDIHVLQTARLLPTRTNSTKCRLDLLEGHERRSKLRWFGRIFLGGLDREEYQSFSSSAPKGRSKAASAVGVERSGLIVVVNLTRTVKSAESWRSRSVKSHRAHC